MPFNCVSRIKERGKYEQMISVLFTISP